MKTYPLNRVMRLIEPGPVVMVSTFHKGSTNLMTMSFLTMMQHEPPLIGISLGPWDFSYTALVETGECVLAVPGVDLIKKVVDIGNCSGGKIDKFEKFKFTKGKAKFVAAPLVNECLANIECKVIDTRLVDDYNFFVVEAKRAITNPDRKEQRIFHHKGDGTFYVSGRTINLQERMVLWKEFQD